jgi:hypothetical protein
MRTVFIEPPWMTAPCIFLRGYFKYIIDTIYHPMMDLEHYATDLLAEEWWSRSAKHSSLRDEFPHINNFTRGFTCLTLLTSSEKVGVIFAMIVLVHAKQLRNIVEMVLDLQQRK